ncbi:MAG: uroporphyrinogen-III synthase [Gallionella sp.]|nr:uroporphyrinogen-III synthase [Gallionella sp.]
MAELPLAGLKIAVTRPREQAEQLTQNIRQFGGVPLSFPLLDIVAEEMSPSLREQIARLGEADLAIFISPNAVNYGMAAIRATGVALPVSLKIATVGSGSAKALRELGVRDILVPAERFDSEGLLALPALRDIAGWRTMIFRGNGGRELLGDTLAARGAVVEYVGCYRRSAASQDGAALLAVAPDAITVTSSEALDHLWQTLDERGRTGILETPLFVPHARIAGLARQQGWRHVHPTASGDDGLLAGLVAWAKKKDGC